MTKNQLVTLENLPEGHQKIIEKIVNGMPIKEAVLSEGYTSRMASTLSRNEKFTRVLRNELNAKALSEGAPMAWETMRELMGKEQKPMVRFLAAKTVLDRTGFFEKKNAKESKDDKRLEDMTASELHELGQELRAARENAIANAKEITVEVNKDKPSDSIDSVIDTDLDMSQQIEEVIKDLGM